MAEPFQRPRDIKRWRVSKYYASIQDFVELPLSDGLHTIEHKGRQLDLLIKDRKSDTTLIVFHGALSPRQRTIPCLQGNALSEAAGVNLIACADPSLDQGAISCAWFLGDKDFGPLPNLLAPILHHCLSQLSSSHTILFGGSGGGYAATNFGSLFPGSIVLAMNPRLNFDASPKSTLDQYLRICHRVQGRTPAMRVKSSFVNTNLSDVVNAGQNFDLLVLQNGNDQSFLNHQLKPFIEELDDTSRVWVSLFDGPAGHAPSPKEEIAAIIENVKSSTIGSAEEQKYKKAGFAPASEVAKQWD